MSSVRVIAPPSRWPSPGLGELWHFRELVYFLAWRDVKVRYKQTVLGVAWALLQPLLNMVVFSIFFGRLAGVPSDGLPYPLFVLTALVLWQIFSYSLTEASASVVANERLITRVYFPRLAIPIAAVLSALLDFAISAVILLFALVAYGVTLSWRAVTAPAFVALAILAAFSVALWLSALNVRYRDVRYTLGFVAQLWLFVTPVAYPASLVPARWALVYSLNPMAAAVEGFRWALLGAPPPRLGAIVASTIGVIVVFVTGLLYFRRTEQVFADVI